MENRFGVKDFFLFVFLSAFIIIILLAMKQNDRQYKVLEDIRDQGDDQMRELVALHQDLNRLKISGVTASGSSAVGSTQPSDDVPFQHILAATTMPGYAQGDWLVDSGPNTDKLTPLVSGDTFGAEIQDHVCESLLIRDEVTLDWEPMLAAELPKVEDNSEAYKEYVAEAKKAGKTDDQIAADPNAPYALKVTFKLRPNVTFSSGDAMTSADVIYSYDMIMNPKIDDPRDRAYFNKIRSVTADGDYSVTFTLNEPYFDYLGLTGGMYILPKNFYSKYSPDDFNKSTGLLMGSGPYQMENPTNWTPGQQVVLVRNDRYWGAPPAFDRLVYKIIDNDLARLTTFRNGDIDYFGAQPEQYNSLVKDPQVLDRTEHFAYDTAVGGYRYIAWNEMKDGKPTVFADKRVRRAMTMLTNRPAICKDIMLGYATPSTGPFSPLGKQYNHDVKAWPYDVDAARALLKAAGCVDDGSGVLKEPDGSPFEFKLTYPSGSTNYDQIALFLKDAYAKAGITCTPDPLDWSVFSDRLKNRNFEAISLGWSAGIEDDIYQMFDSSQMLDGGDDFMSYKNPELDKLIEQARTTIDEKKRLDLWKQCHVILHEDQPYTFLFTRKSLVFLDKRIENVRKVSLGLNSSYEWFVPRALQKWEK